MLRSDLMKCLIIWGEWSWKERLLALHSWFMVWKKVWAGRRYLDDQCVPMESWILWMKTGKGRESWWVLSSRYTCSRWW